MTPTTTGTLRTADTLTAGATQTGTVCGDRPVQTGVYALLYEPSVLGARRGVWPSQLQPPLAASVRARSRELGVP